MVRDASRRLAQQSVFNYRMLCSTGVEGGSHAEQVVHSETACTVTINEEYRFVKLLQSTLKLRYVG